jgi:hypothetical protein
VEGIAQHEYTGFFEIEKKTYDTLDEGGVAVKVEIAGGEGVNLKIGEKYWLTVAIDNGITKSDIGQGVLLCLQVAVGECCGQRCTYGIEFCFYLLYTAAYDDVGVFVAGGTPGKNTLQVNRNLTRLGGGSPGISVAKHYTQK